MVGFRGRNALLGVAMMCYPRPPGLGLKCNDRLNASSGSVSFQAKERASSYIIIVEDMFNRGRGASPDIGEGQCGGS